MKTKKIEVYSLYDFLKAIQEAVTEGYRLSDTNEHFPRMWTGYYACTMVMEEDEEGAEEDTLLGSSEKPSDAIVDDTPSVPPVEPKKSTRGRKKGS